MSPIRVLIVDDSVVIRKLLTQTLATDSAIEVAGTASNGKIAIAKIGQVNPDLIILDVEMPEMDGLETLTNIRKDWPKLPVIMFSTKTERGAVATVEALTRGASDYVAKPSNVGSVMLAMERVREVLIPKIKALVPRGQRPLPPSPRLSAKPEPLPSGKPAPLLSARPGAVEVLRPGAPGALLGAKPALNLPARVPGTEAVVELVVIGASTGGPNALTTLLPKLPANFPVPIVIVQHMLAAFTRHFAERLALQCKLRVVEPSHGDPIQAGTIYIAKGDYHLLVNRRGREGFVTLNQGAPENFCRPAVDVMFDSASSAYGASVLGVVLTGMGQDGYRGSRLIRQAGGNVIVQDEATSIVWGMPGMVASAGLATQVLPLERVAGEVERLVTQRRGAPYKVATAP
jgi:two-component system, chemotaxis family, protein-glutamate methylesterase/glutaminase